MLNELQSKTETEQPLLGAVVEIALEPAALLVGGQDDARARGTEVHELGTQLRLEALYGLAERRTDPSVIRQALPTGGRPGDAAVRQEASRRLSM